MRTPTAPGSNSRKVPRVNPSEDHPRRRWERLPIAIPVFVRGIDEKGNEFVEFTTAININAGGMLLLSRRVLPPGSELTLEIPTPTPFYQPPGRPTKNALPARVLYMRDSDEYHLCALEFTSPLLPQEGKPD
jgi:PilZ domain